jgi:hypothetical protein
MKWWPLLLASAIIAGNSPAAAETGRVVRFMADDFPPSAVYWQHPGGQMVQAQPSAGAFRLSLPAQSGLIIILIYKFAGSEYLPPTSEIQLKLNVDQQADPLDLPLPLHRWKACTRAALDGISAYPQSSTYSLVRTILEARLLLTFQREAACQDFQGKVQLILADRRRQLPVFISFP